MIIDTNVYSAFDRGDRVADKLLDANEELLLPLQVVAELLYGFTKGNRENDNLTNLHRFISLPTVSLCVPDYETTKFYAEIQLSCTQAGRVLSNNDVWIAALAYQHGQKLATFDKDFKAVETFLGKNLILL